MGWVFVFVMSLVILAILYMVGQTLQSKIDAWRREAAQLGLSFEQGETPASNRMSGVFRGYSVLVEAFKRNWKIHTRVKVEGVHIPKELELRPEGSWPDFTKPIAGEDILTGDELFDREVRVSGPELIAVAFLGQDARTSLRNLISAGGRVKQGFVRLERQEDIVEAGTIRDDIEALVCLASGLPAGSIPQRLLANATDDWDAGVRLRSLRFLAEKFPGDEETKRAGQAALADEEPAVRLLAATLVGGPGATAVLKPLLEDDKNPNNLLRDAVRAAGTSKDASLLPPLYALVPKRDPGLAESLATALGQFGDMGAENALLELMNQDAVGVKRAAATSLGLVGTIRSVEPLLLLSEGSLKNVAREAVRKIQARLGDAEGGRLSIATQEAAVGGLSIAVDGGALSVAPDDAKEDAPPHRDPVKS